ncbi:MAG: amino acid racemase [Eubacteriales bacterium]|nr:amino acid racemase [Eubacteriales bacterium]
MTLKEALKEYPYLYETHLHTIYGSQCGRETAETMAKCAKEAGYAGMFVTEHNWNSFVSKVDKEAPWPTIIDQMTEGYREARAWGEANDFDVFFGYEAFYDATEFLIYGITPEWLKEHPEIRDASIEEQYELIKGAGGMVIQAHPFRKEDYIPEIRLYPEYSDGAEALNATHSSHLSVVHQVHEWDEMALEYAWTNNLKIAAGSDVHRKTMLMGGILVKERFKSGSDYVDTILNGKDHLLSDGEDIFDKDGRKMKKTIGILGGMGPLATADLFKKIIELTDAANDQDHVRVIIDSNTNIPDRTAAILHGGKSPVEELTKSARLLENAGADLLIMPCNTAHYFVDYVKEAVNIPVVSIIESAADKVLSRGFNKAVILATDGTIQAGVYEKIFKEKGIETIYPDEKIQKNVMSIIYEGVKAGTPREGRMDELTGEINAFLKKEASVAVLACTELPLAVELYGLSGDFVDATKSLAEAAILAAGYELKK